MSSKSRYRFIECVGQDQQLRLAIGADRVPVDGLRPQAEKLIRYMIQQNESGGTAQKIYSHEELQQAIWGRRRLANQKGQLARLICEIRQILGPPLGGDSLIVSVPGQGYVLENAGSQNLPQSSPFVCGPPITHPSGFFGRDAELKRIFAIWNRFPLQNIAVLGARRSGKTSLFHYLERIHLTPSNALRPGQKRQWTPGTEGHRVVFIDCQDARFRTPEAILEHIMEQLGMPVLAPCSLAAFAERISRISCRTILLFDELEAALSNPDFDSDFWAGLRSLGSNYTRGLLGFVIALHEEPSPLMDSKDSQSPFMNIFGHTLTLGPLAENEALDLIGSSPMAFSTGDVQWILKESGCHPCLVQLLCDTRLTALEEDQPSEVWKTEGLSRIKRFMHLLNQR